MGEGCTRNRPPPAERVFLHVDEWRHTMEWHGGQTSHRKRREGFWPLCEAEVQRPADVSRRVYVRLTSADERLGLGTGWPAEEVWQKIELPGSVPDVKCMTLQLE